MTRITEDTQEMVGLLPCPFCGGKAHWPEPEVNMPYVGCQECGACIQDEVRWNTRAEASQLAGVVGERDALRAAAMGMRQVLVRYRNETPLGHQPHMIAHVADLAIAEFDAALSPNQGARS